MRSSDDMIMAIIRNGSGQYSGEIDYTYGYDKVNNLNNEDLRDVRQMLLNLVNQCDERLFKRGLKTSLSYRVSRIIDLKYFPVFKKNYHMWPISISWFKPWNNPPYITTHGWQTGWKNGERIYGWTLHLGRLKIKFGKDTTK